MEYILLHMEKRRTPNGVPFFKITSTLFMVDQASILPAA